MKKENFFLFLALLGLILFISFRSFLIDVPSTWDMKEIKRFHLPPPDSTVEVVYAPEAYYNSLSEHNIHETYPYYVKEYQPEGYLDSLKKLKPKVIDFSKIRTQEDWIKAGEAVFHWPAAYRRVDENFIPNDSAFLKKAGDKYTEEGVYPFSSYMKFEGSLYAGNQSCATCHTQVTKEGKTIIGAGGNHAFDPGFALILESGALSWEQIKAGNKGGFYAPWAADKVPVVYDSLKEFIAYLKKVPPGAMFRQGVGLKEPVAVPDLIGLKDIKYFDRTGLMRHNNPGDLMRYAAFNQGMDMLTSYDDFLPMVGVETHSELTADTPWRHPFGYAALRYSDAQLYALTQFIYSLKPPENPHDFPEEVLKRGERLFKEQACITCHTPPAYTNNKLLPANGFEPPVDHLEKYDIFNISVETDSALTLYSRRGTGYYKVPSLRGLWYREVFFHDASLANLEDVLDPARLEPDFVPTGFKPPHVEHKAVKGHPFGMELSKEDREALIAYLKTL